MRKLDPGRPWGKITPPWSGDNKEFDRPAVKEQDGRLFDQYNCEILPPGKRTKSTASIQRPAPPPVAAEPDDDGGDTMQRLDPSFLENSPDVGKVTPTGWRGDNDEFDRAACYHYDGKFFDAHGIEIVPGKNLKRAAAPPPPPPVEEPDEGEEIEEQAAAPRNESEVRSVAPPVTKSAPISPAELLERADSMAFAKFAAAAKSILGPTCPAGKQAIVAALRETIAGHENAKPYSQGMTWGGINGETPAPEAPTPVAPAAKAKMPVFSRQRRQG